MEFENHCGNLTLKKGAFESLTGQQWEKFQPYLYGTSISRNVKM